MAHGGYHIYAALASPDGVYAEFAVPTGETHARHPVTPSRRQRKGNLDTQASKTGPRPFRPPGVLPSKPSVDNPHRYWPSTLDGVDAAHWQPLRSGAPIKPDGSFVSEATSKVEPAGRSPIVRKSGRRRFVSAPAEAKAAGAKAKDNETSRQQGRRTFHSNSKHVGAIDQVVFGQGFQPSSTLNSNIDIAGRFKGHAGKSSWNVMDEGEEFLLTNDGPLYATSGQTGDAVRIPHGRRKYKEKYETAATAVLYPSDQALDLVSLESYSGGSSPVGSLTSRTSPSKNGGHDVLTTPNKASSHVQKAAGSRSRSVPAKLHSKGKRRYSRSREDEMSLADFVSGGPTVVQTPEPEKKTSTLHRSPNLIAPFKTLPPPPPPVDAEKPGAVVIGNCLSSPLPTLFVSHGTGAFPLMWDYDHPAKQSFGTLVQQALGDGISSVKVVVVVSAHWETDDGIEVTLRKGSQAHHLFYDYCGFPSEMYKLNYNPMGHAEMTQQILERLQAFGFHASANTNRRLDHGVFVPLLLLPGLDKLPLVQISLPRLSNDWQHNAQRALRMGRALAPLRSMGALLLGSGQSTSTHRARADAEHFVTMLKRTCSSVDAKWRTSQLELWRKVLPQAREVHEREEHLLPLLVVAGAAEDEPGFVEGDCWSGSLAMTHFRFGASLSKNEENHVLSTTVDQRDAIPGVEFNLKGEPPAALEDQEIQRTSIRSAHELGASQMSPIFWLQDSPNVKVGLCAR